MDKASEAIKAIDIWKSYGAREVLKGVNLRVMRGEVVVVIGPSASGKTTLLRCLNGLITPDRGEIHIAGQPLNYREVNGKRVARPERDVLKTRTRIGMVFQHFNLFAHMTALENVIEAPIHVLRVPPVQARGTGLALLEKVGLPEHIDHYPNELSGGQKQRVAIARALAMHPEVMLFDEPTSALDPELIGEVLEVMKQLALEGTTMVVVTHEINFAREVGDRIVVLESGRVLEEGRPEEVLDNPKTQRLRDFLRRVV